MNLQKTKKFFLALPLVTALFASFGCVSPKTSGVLVEKGRIAIENPAFASNIEIIRDSREMTEDGYLHVQVVLKNTNHSDYQCQYSIEWIGKNRMVLKHAPSPWRPLVLHGRETKEIDVVSPIPGAEDFRLKLRRMD